MGQVTITLNGSTYKLRCGDEDEERLLVLAEHVRSKVDQIAGQYGQIGDAQLLLMCALMITDELIDARETGQHKHVSFGS